MTKDIKEALDMWISQRSSQIAKNLRYNPQTHEAHEGNGHTIGCGCLVCKAKYEYVSVKLTLHRTKRHLETVFDVLEANSDIEKSIEVLEKKVENYKKRYHSLNEQIEQIKKFQSGTMG